MDVGAEVVLGQIQLGMPEPPPFWLGILFAVINPGHWHGFRVPRLGGCAFAWGSPQGTVVGR